MFASLCLDKSTFRILGRFRQAAQYELSQNIRLKCNFFRLHQVGNNLHKSCIFLWHRELNSAWSRMYLRHTTFIVNLDKNILHTPNTFLKCPKFDLMSTGQIGKLCLIYQDRYNLHIIDTIRLCSETGNLKDHKHQLYKSSMPHPDTSIVHKFDRYLLLSKSNHLHMSLQCKSFLAQALDKWIIHTLCTFHLWLIFDSQHIDH